MNLRAEPLLFLSQGNDMIPYTACTSDLMYYTNDPLNAYSRLSAVTDAEVALRKEARRCDVISYDVVILKLNLE